MTCDHTCAERERERMREQLGRRLISLKADEECGCEWRDSVCLSCQARSLMLAELNAHPELYIGPRWNAERRRLAPRAGR